jgi:hypothetical protein
VNRFLENISNLFNESNKEIGFGSKAKSINSRKALLFQELKSESSAYEEYIDGVIYKDLEFDKLKKLSNKNVLNGLIFPDKMINLEKLENCNFDFVILHDLNISSEFLLSEKIASGFYINSNLDDSTYDTINNIPFSFVVIDLIKKPKYETLSGIFDLTKIISNIDNNIILKLDYIPTEKTLELLYLLGIVGVIIDSEAHREDKFKILDKYLKDLKGDIKKKPILYPNISNNMDFIPYDDEE